MVDSLALVLSNFVDSAVAFIPNLVGAIILLVIGLIVGKVLGRVVHEVLERINLDYYITESKKPTFSVTHLLVVIVRWWVYLGFIAAAVSVLGITELTLWVREILAFIPNIIGAALIVIVGYILAEYIRKHLRNTQQVLASIVGKVLFFFIIYVSIALALPVLGISATLVNNILLVIIGSVGLGVAIALGLGMKDAVSEISKKWVKRLKI
jgi:hypothetical protein